MEEINEKNINSFIENNYNLSQSWLCVLDTLSKKVEGHKKFHSLKNNYLTLFLYYLINKKINIHDFNNVVDKIYKDVSEELLEATFNRFFSKINSHSLNFMNSKRNNIWDDITLVFVENENNKLIINKKTEPYLLSLLALITKEKVGSIYGGAFINFTTHLEINSLKNIFNEIEKNDAFLISMPKYFNNFYLSYLETKLSLFFSKSKDDKLKEFNILNNNIPKLSDKLEEALYKHDNDELSVSLVIVKFLIDIKYDLIGLLNTKYINRCIDLDNDPFLSDKDRYKKITKIHSNLIYALKEMIYKSDYNIRFNDINIHENKNTNWIYLLSLCDKIKKNENINLSEEQMLYIENLYKNSNNNMYENFLDEESEIDKKLLESFILNRKLDNVLTKNNQVKRVKI